MASRGEFAMLKKYSFLTMHDVATSLCTRDEWKICIDFLLFMPCVPIFKNQKPAYFNHRFRQFRSFSDTLIAIMVTVIKVFLKAKDSITKRQLYDFIRIKYPFQNTP